MMFIGRSLSTGRAIVLKVNSSGKKNKTKQHTVPNVCQNRRPYRTHEYLFQFSASPTHILGTTVNATFSHFMKKSMHLKTAFLSDYQVLFLLLNGPQFETSFCSIDFDRFMTSECSNTLILPISSKTGQSVK